MTLLFEAANIRAGGGVTHLLELLAHARPKEFGFDRVVVWAPQRTLDKLADRPWLEKRTHPWLNRGSFFRIAWVQWVLPRLLRGRKELLLSLDAIPIPYHPYVTICQNQLPFDLHERRRFGFSLTHLRLKMLSWSQTKAFRQADGMIYLTKASATGVFQFAPDLAQIPHQVVHHGLHRRFWADHSNAQPPAGMHTPARLVYVSIINLYKHQWVVAEAVLQLVREGHKISLDLVGPAYPPALRRLEKVLSQYPDASKTVRYMGPQEYAAMDQLIQNADILLFASTCETFGLTLLEAMASGKPVLSSDIPVARELIGDNAGYFDPENVESVKAAILEALHDPEAARQKAARAYESVSSFSWQKTADETFSFLQEIASKTTL